MRFLRSLDVYDFLRYAAAAFLLLNSTHRVLNPQTGTAYMYEGFFQHVPITDLQVVYTVMAFSFISAIFILLDIKTWVFSGLIASGIAFVSIMLFIQTGYIAENSADPYFVDVAFRDVAIAGLFIALSLISRQKEAEPLVNNL